MTTRRHCEPHESGPIPHTHLEPVLSSRGRRPWRSMYFGAMDCFTSFAKTTGSWKAQRGNPCLRHALVDCHASLAMTGLDADASLAMAALLSCIWETSRITAIRARSHACARRSHFFCPIQSRYARWRTEVWRRLVNHDFRGAQGCEIPPRRRT